MIGERLSVDHSSSVLKGEVVQAPAKDSPGSDIFGDKPDASGHEKALR